MTVRTRTTLRAALALLLIWAAFFATRAWTAATVPTPDRLAAQLARDLPSEAAERQAWLDTLAQRYRRLDAVGRRTVRTEHAAVWEANLARLAAEEKDRFATALLPPSMDQMLRTLSDLPPDQQQRTLDRARRHLQRRMEDEGGRAEWSAVPTAFLGPMLQNLARNGLASLPTDVKLRLLPYVEQLEANLRNVRN